MSLTSIRRLFMPCSLAILSLSLIHCGSSRKGPREDSSQRSYLRQLTSEKERASISFIFVGDSGHNDENQKINASAMQGFCNTFPCHLVAYMGDNFPAGVTNPDDLQFETRFENVYRSFDIPFYVVLGNHDYEGNYQAEIDYTAKSKKWHLPLRYYSYQIGSADMFVIDTNNLDNDQKIWLESSLKGSTAAWKIVIGHHPIFSSGRHGDNSSLIDELLPILQDGGANFYLTGHDHDKEVITNSGIHFIVCGTGSKPRPFKKIRGDAQFTSSKLGFCHMTITDNHAELNILDDTKHSEYVTTFIHDTKS